MDKVEIIKEIVFQSIDEVNQQLLPEQQIDKSIETVLVGNESPLDSMSLVTLIVVVEGKLIDKFGVSITLMDERATLAEENPFRTVATFVDYIAVLLDEQGIV